jgi:hypothetical protein
VRRCLAIIGGCLLLSGCGAQQAPVTHGGRAGIPQSLVAGERPIGRGPRFQPPNLGNSTGPCLGLLGPRRQAHVEIFGANRVVLLAAGIGARAPRRFRDGRLVHARCFGEVVTIDPTGTVYFRTGHQLTLGDLFDAWGQPLTRTRIASFGGSPVRTYVNGHARGGDPRQLPLTPNAEIVIEEGPHVPPHTHFQFLPKPPAGLN